MFTMPTLDTTCPTWCAGHTQCDGDTFHERQYSGDRWAVLLGRDDNSHTGECRTLIRVEVPSFSDLNAAEAVELAQALIEAAGSIAEPVGQPTGQDVARVQQPAERPARRYSTRTEAIQREVVEPLGEYVEDHDVEAIAAAVLGDYSDGYACMVDAPTFWATVERNAAPSVPSTERVRRTYAFAEDSTPKGFKAAGEAFDAWLATHDAELLAGNTTAGA